MANDKWCADARQLLIEIERIYEDHYSRSYNQCVHDIFNAMRRIVRRNATFRTVEVVHGRMYSTHEVAEIIADLFGDTCACNFDGIDEWLPFKCELQDCCPNTYGVACWEQYLKFYGERKNNESNS